MATKHTKHNHDENAGGGPPTKEGYPVDPPPAGVEEQIRQGGLPADDPRRQPEPASRNPQTEATRLAEAEKEIQEQNAEQADKEQKERQRSEKSHK